MGNPKHISQGFVLGLFAVNQFQAKKSRVLFLRLNTPASKKFLYAVRSWRNNWDDLTTFFEYPIEIRQIIYTTNLIENLNGKIRKYTKAKLSYPNANGLHRLNIFQFHSARHMIKRAKTIKNSNFSPAFVDYKLYDKQIFGNVHPLFKVSHSTSPNMSVHSLIMRFPRRFLGSCDASRH